LTPPKLSDFVTDKEITPIETATSASKPTLLEAERKDAPETNYDDERNIVLKRDFDVESSEVKDRWSRYIGAMGIDAVRRQASSTVFISGMSALGAEIAKNVVLSGVKQMTIHDTTLTQVSLVLLIVALC
jgi:hypothetical protein